MTLVSFMVYGIFAIPCVLWYLVGNMVQERYGERYHMIPFKDWKLIRFFFLNISMQWNSGTARYTEPHKCSVQGLDSVCVELKHRLKISGSPAASCRDPPWSEETLLTQHEQNDREWPAVTFTTVYHQNWEKYVHRTTSDLIKTRLWFLVWIQSIHAFKNDFRSMQVTQEGWLAVCHWWSLIGEI